MKQLIVTMLILIAAIAIIIYGLLFMATSPAHGFEGGFEVQARVSQMLYNNSELKANPGEELETLELRIIYEGVFAYGSVDPLRMWGQDIEMYSVGIGGQMSFWDHFRAYLKIGYDMPQYDSDGFIWEPLWFHLNQAVAPTIAQKRWHHYTAEIDPSFSGELGLDYKRHVYKGLSLGFFGAWKVAKHQVSAYGLEEDGIAGVTGWQVIENWDFGGCRVGILAEWKF